MPVNIGNKLSFAAIVRSTLVEKTYMKFVVFKEKLWGIMGNSIWKICDGGIGEQKGANVYDFVLP